MKNSFKMILAGCAAACTMTAAVAAQADMVRKQSPIWQMRHTLTMPFGQRTMTLEAPLGMCFLDESQYLEGSVIKQLRGSGTSSDGGLLMTMFANCDELEKFSQLPQLQADTPPGVDPPKAELSHEGSISWMSPKLGKAPMTVPEYLDMRAPHFRDEMKDALAKQYKEMGGSSSIKIDNNISAQVMMGSPDQYVFDDKARRTDNGLSIGYSVEYDAEYTHHRQVGVIGTTLLRHYPVEISLTSPGSEKNDTKAKLQDLLDKYMAQVSAMNP